MVGQLGRNVEMRIGFGIYRDYPDCPDECWDNLGDIRTYDSSMAEAIQSIECKSKGTNRPEAVYQGILENLSSWYPDVQEPKHRCIDWRRGEPHL